LNSYVHDGFKPIRFEISSHWIELASEPSSYRLKQTIIRQTGDFDMESPEYDSRAWRMSVECVPVGDGKMVYDEAYSSIDGTDRRYLRAYNPRRVGRRGDDTPA